MANHQKLLDWIENELINQNLHLGDQLPDDRELARKVGVSQNHMREILKSCEEIGILRLYEGRKKSILSELVREPAVIAGPAVGLHLASSTHPQRDLVQTCLLLETHAVSTEPADMSALPELDRLLGGLGSGGAGLGRLGRLAALGGLDVLGRLSLLGGLGRLFLGL